MPRIAAFEAHSERYEAWFARNEAAYLSELLAVRVFLPWSGRGLEIRSWWFRPARGDKRSFTLLIHPTPDQDRSKFMR